MLTELKKLYLNKQIRALDYQFSRFISKIDKTPMIVLVAALVSYELGQGNICFTLSHLIRGNLFAQNRAFSKKIRKLVNLSANISMQALEKQLLISSIVSNGTENTPLVLDQERLYFYRYWQHECRVTDYLKRPIQFQYKNIDFYATEKILDRLFQRNYQSLYNILNKKLQDHDLQNQLIQYLDIEISDTLNWSDCYNTIRSAKRSEDLCALNDLIPQNTCLNLQKVAAALAALQPLSVLSGGPGTGKTTTVTRLLAMLIEIGLNVGKIPEIRLVAPTGKASARLTQSIGKALATLNCSAEVKALIPIYASTIHRLLGVIQPVFRYGVIQNQPVFRYNVDNKLHLDILVIDEASMVDLTLMRQLLDALPDHARVILLGDRDQLSSVEAGNVFIDICNAAEGGYSTGQIKSLEALTNFQLKSLTNPEQPVFHESVIKDRFCLLKKNYRFDAKSGIAKLAATVKKGNFQETLTIFKLDCTNIILHNATNDVFYQKLLSLCVDGYQKYLVSINDGLDLKDVLRIFNSFRLLCALREGKYGVDQLNRNIQKGLAQRHLLPAEETWYIGRPVLILENSHSLGLYNGDIGITLLDKDGKFRVAFELPDGSIRHLLPSRLPAHQTVFAMTIHKSQGSEFFHTVMILPDQISQVLTRELIYTGITRATEKLDLFATHSILKVAIQNKTARISGLTQRLLNT